MTYLKYRSFEMERRGENGFLSKSGIGLLIIICYYCVIMSDMCDIYISEIKANLRRADELIAQGRADNDCK